MKEQHWWATQGQLDRFGWEQEVLAGSSQEDELQVVISVTMDIRDAWRLWAQANRRMGRAILLTWPGGASRALTLTDRNLRSAADSAAAAIHEERRGLRQVRFFASCPNALAFMLGTRLNGVFQITAMDYRNDGYVEDVDLRVG